MRAVFSTLIGNALFYLIEITYFKLDIRWHWHRCRMKRSLIFATLESSPGTKHQPTQVQEETMKTTLMILLAGLLISTTPYLASAKGWDRMNGDSFYDRTVGHSIHHAPERHHQQVRHPRPVSPHHRRTIVCRAERRAEPRRPLRVYRPLSGVIISLPQAVFHLGW